MQFGKFQMDPNITQSCIAIGFEILLSDNKESAQVVNMQLKKF